MSSQQLSQEVAELEAQVASMLEQLDRLAEASRHDITAQAETWIDSEVTRKIQESPATIQALGGDRLRALKTKVLEMRSATGSVV